MIIFGYPDLKYIIKINFTWFISLRKPWIYKLQVYALNPTLHCPLPNVVKVAALGRASQDIPLLLLFSSNPLGMKRGLGPRRNLPKGEGPWSGTRKMWQPLGKAEHWAFRCGQGPLFRTVSWIEVLLFLLVYQPDVEIPQAQVLGSAAPKDLAPAGHAQSDGPSSARKHEDHVVASTTAPWIYSSSGQHQLKWPRNGI